MSEPVYDPNDPSHWSGRTIAIASVGYALLLTVVMMGLREARRSVIENLGTPAAKQDWQDWKQAERERLADPNSAVRRRVPKSDEPPALVLMRDYFKPVAGISIATASVIYWFLAIVVASGRGGPIDPMAGERPPQANSP